MSQFINHMPSSRLPTEKSAYYWWYMFLREVPGYGENHDQYSKFGDLSAEFVDWWTDHSVLFYDGFGYGVARHDTAENFLEVAEMFARVGMETWMVSVRPDFSRKDMIAQFKWMLDRHGIVNTPGIKDPHASSKLAVLRLHQRPNVLALKKMWQCVVARRMLNEKGFKADSYRIATIVGISQENWLTDGDTKQAKSDKKNRIGAIVGRYLYKADRLIKNVGEGRFPDYT